MRRYTFEMVPKRSFGLGKLLAAAGVAAGAYYAYQYLTEHDSYEKFDAAQPVSQEDNTPDEDADLTQRILRAAKRVVDR